MVTAKSAAHSQFFALLCSGRWSKCGPGHDPLLLLATDAIPTGYSKHRQGDSGQVQQTNRLDQAGFKDSANMEVQEQTTRGSFRGKKKRDFYCVTRENICKLLTRPRHQEKNYIRKIYMLYVTLKLLRNIY